MELYHVTNRLGRYCRSSRFFANRLYAWAKAGAQVTDSLPELLFYRASYLQDQGQYRHRNRAVAMFLYSWPGLFSLAAEYSMPGMSKMR